MLFKKLPVAVGIALATTQVLADATNFDKFTPDTLNKPAAKKASRLAGKSGPMLMGANEPMPACPGFAGTARWYQA